MQADPSRAKDWGSDLTPKKSFTIDSLKAKDLRTKAHTNYASSSSGKEIKQADYGEMSEEDLQQLRTKKLDSNLASLIMRHPKEKVAAHATGIVSEIS